MFQIDCLYGAARLEAVLITRLPEAASWRPGGGLVGSDLPCSGSVGLSFGLLRSASCYRLGVCSESRLRQSRTPATITSPFRRTGEL